MSKPDFIVGAQVFDEFKSLAMEAGQKIKCKGYSMILEDGFVIRVSPHLKPDEVVAETPRADKALNTILKRYLNDEQINEISDDVDSAGL